MLIQKRHISKYNFNFLKLVGLFILTVFFTFSCKKQSAQYPSNKVQKTDSIEFALRDYNQEVAQKEDSAIVAFISNQPVTYKKSESGVWYFIQKKTENPLLTSDSSVVINYKMHSIQGELLTNEHEKTVHFGKKEVLNGLEEGLKLMRKGETARFIVPSFLAYGAKGTEEIPPYSPLIFVVESK